MEITRWIAGFAEAFSEVHQAGACITGMCAVTPAPGARVVTLHGNFRALAIDNARNLQEDGNTDQNDAAKNTGCAEAQVALPGGRWVDPERPMA